MAQFDFPTLDPDVVTGTDLAAFLNNWEAAVESSHSGAARPAYVRAGMLWVRQVSGTLWELSLYDGSSDIVIANINPSTNTFTPPNDSVGSAALQANAVLTGNIVNLAVTAAKLGADAVETSKILNAAVTTAKIAGGSITIGKIAAALIANATNVRNKSATTLMTPASLGDGEETVNWSYASSFTPNNATFINASMVVSGNLTMNNFSNYVPGRIGGIRLFLTSGSHVVSWGSGYFFGDNNTPPDLQQGRNVLWYWNFEGSTTYAGLAGTGFGT